MESPTVASDKELFDEEDDTEKRLKENYSWNVFAFYHLKNSKTWSNMTIKVFFVNKKGKN